MIFKIILICIFALCTILVIKDNLYGKIIALGAGLITIWVTIPYITEFVRHINHLANSVEGLDNCLKMTLKIIGVAFVCEFASQLCIDAGESYLASKINFAGKIMIICITIPDFLALINIVVTLINEI